jgi:hypothetical protein
MTEKKKKTCWCSAFTNSPLTIITEYTCSYNTRISTRRMRFCCYEHIKGRRGKKEITNSVAAANGFVFVSCSSLHNVPCMRVHTQPV